MAEPTPRSIGDLHRAERDAGKHQRIRITLECQECGKKWRVSPNANDPECPKCGGIDYEVRDY